MKLARLLLLMTVVALWPATAHAARGWWGWLEELSGPGLFGGPLYSMPVKCWKPDGSSTPCGLFQKHVGIERDRRIGKSLQITFGWLSSGDRPRFKDLVESGQDDDSNHRRVIAIPVNATLMFRPHRSLDIGPGAGLLFFAGQDVHANARFVIIPVTASWKFLLSNNSWTNSSWRRIFGLEFQTTFITNGFNGADFGSSVTTFKSRPEFRGIVGISIDVGEWR